MPYHRLLFLIAICLSLPGCGPPPGSDAKSMPDLRASVAGEGNNVAIQRGQGVAVIDIYSRSGIGRGEVEAPSGAFPASVVLRLHIQSLEELRLTYDEITLIVSVPNQAGGPIRQSILNTSTAGEQPVGLESPYWMRVAIVPPQGTPSPSVGEGYIEVELPPDFQSQSRRSISFQWVDVFR
jgi:hypothetical protein